MHNYKIEYAEIYETDLFNILDYIALDNINAALTFSDEIAKIISSLNEFPFKGSNSDDPNLRLKGYRKLIVGNYIIFYVPYPEEEIIYVHRILSAKLDYQNLF